MTELIFNEIYIDILKNVIEISESLSEYISFIIYNDMLKIEISDSGISYFVIYFKVSDKFIIKKGQSDIIITLYSEILKKVFKNIQSSDKLVILIDDNETSVIIIQKLKDIGNLNIKLNVIEYDIQMLEIPKVPIDNMIKMITTDYLSIIKNILLLGADECVIELVGNNLKFMSSQNNNEIKIENVNYKIGNQEENREKHMKIALKYVEMYMKICISKIFQNVYLCISNIGEPSPFRLNLMTDNDNIYIECLIAPINEE